MWSYGEICAIDCASASEFLFELDETNPRWKHDRWIFRGQPVDTCILPTAMRSPLIDSFVNKESDNYNYLYLDTSEPYHSMWESEDMFDRHVRVVLQVVAEREIVYAFEELADEVRLDVPTEKHFVVAEGDERISLSISILLSLRDKSILIDPTGIGYALARHHGMPSRLVDWTYRPYNAAFFAAHCEKETRPNDSQLVVWAVSSRGIHWTSLQKVAHRRSMIGFLQSQDGVFLYDTNANQKYMDKGKWQPFEDEFRRIPTRGQVFKVTLPYSERVELLDRLRLKHVTKHHLMPSFDNVAEAIRLGRVDWKRVNYDINTNSSGAVK